MGGRRFILVFFALLDTIYVPYGESHEKDDMRQLPRQLRPNDGGAAKINSSDVDSALVLQPSPPGTSTHHMQLIVSSSTAVHLLQGKVVGR